MGKGTDPSILKEPKKIRYFNEPKKGSLLPRPTEAEAYK